MSSDSRKEYRHNYYRQNRERLLAKSRKWFEEHPNYIKEYYTVHKKVSVTNKNRTPKMWNAQIKALEIPLAEKCELCPEGDERKAVNRHHPDYNYPTIFLSLCKSCHVYVHKDLLAIDKNDCGRAIHNF